MAKYFRPGSRKSSGKKRRGTIIFLLVAALSAFGLSYSWEDIRGFFDGTGGPAAKGPEEGGRHEWVYTEDLGKDLAVHFIDVDQADAIFIQQGDVSLIIDSGTREYGPVVVNYLEKLGITKIDLVIGTHPHADHIGGLAEVISTFDIGEVILPEVSHTTKSFRDLLGAIDSKGLGIIPAVPGDKYELGDCELEIVGPIVLDQEDLNNSSIVCRLVYGDTAFLFTGDAESESEKLILQAGYKLQADVLKVGHHGSYTSTSAAFLKAVDPDIAVIMCGVDNPYGYPHREIRERLERAKVDIYRTDLHGSVTVISDGKKITVKHG